MKNDRKLAREPMADACPRPLGVREGQSDGVSLRRWSAAGMCRNRRQRPDQGDRVGVCSGSGPVSGNAASLPTGQRTWPLRVPRVRGVSVSGQDGVAPTSSVILNVHLERLSSHTRDKHLRWLFNVN